MAEVDLIWLDLETTGLDPSRDFILEVYAFKASLEDPFTKLGEPYHAVIKRSPAKLRLLMSKEVDEMHTANGLKLACTESGTAISANTLDAELTKWLGPTGEKPPMLAGRSIHFDAGFLKLDCPVFFSRLHYRMFDMTSVDTFCQMMSSPPLKELIPNSDETTKHRAERDIAHTLKQLEAAFNYVAGSENE